MKTAIIYYSTHPGNTKQLLNAIAKENDVTLMDITKGITEDLSTFDRIGFASGIYYSKFHRLLLDYAKNNLPDGKDVFFLYTYGAKKDGYTNSIADAVSVHDAHVLGEFGCFGFNTFGPFKLIGGIAKGHPDADDLSNAVKFYQSL